MVVFQPLRVVPNERSHMFYNTWTPSYTAPTVSGVTGGAITVPTFKPADWSLIGDDVNSATYRTNIVDTTGLITGTELTVKCSTISNPYAADKQRSIPLSNQAVGLVSRKVYAKLTDYGAATVTGDTDSTCSIPLRISMAIEVPFGVAITDSVLKDQTALVISALSNALTAGTVVPMSHVSAIAGGAVRIGG